MSRDIVPLGLRMPPEVKEQIEAAAKANNRSMNAEIVARLQASFDAPPSMEAVTLAHMMAMQYAQEHGIPQSEALSVLVMKGVNDKNKHVAYLAVESGVTPQEMRQALRILEDGSAPDAGMAFETVPKRKKVAGKKDD